MLRRRVFKLCHVQLRIWEFALFQRTDLPVMSVMRKKKKRRRTSAEDHEEEDYNNIKHHWMVSLEGEELEAQKERLCGKIAELSASLVRAQAQKERLCSKIADLSTSVGRTEAEKEKLVGKLAESATSLARAEAAAVESTEQNARLLAELSTARARSRDLMDANARLQAELQQPQVQSEEVDTLKGKVAALEWSVQSSDAEMENWRNPVDVSIAPFSTYGSYDRPELLPMVEAFLRELVPHSHRWDKDCGWMSCIQVTNVTRIVNTELWKSFKDKQSKVAKQLEGETECPWMPDVFRDAWVAAKKLPYVRLNKYANEMLLLHGTSEWTAWRIAEQGFDERHCNRGLYGNGVYFTPDTCKAAQSHYTGEDGCIIISRVTLGHPYFADTAMAGKGRPPDIPGRERPHDATIARPGISKGKGKGTQVHNEVVMSRCEALVYPEMIVKFKR
eukprot:TRINITY_DN52244_c0_g1_i1.p1 TRINITY_DN52244_c0_g1~~TRINITY_DN52244_c0_g1_i1.p1  ORF type:complete len:447 (-),score=61.33 TRINITY_DN52244_c0_g1_i1:31-1371(-)